MVSVIASNIRKGHVVEKDGKLYVVLTAENIHPGKGTPVTQLEMRRISDGVKVNERYKTTDTLEKAFIEERTQNFLYQDGDHYVFMDPETFDQVHVGADVIGDMALVGHPLIGHLVAHRGGHALHTAFAAQVLEESDAWMLVESAGQPERADAAAAVPAKESV